MRSGCSGRRSVGGRGRRSRARGSSSPLARGCGAGGAWPSRACRCARPARPSTRSARCPWGDRARHELRASGVRSRRRAPDARDELTPQELQIAQLAAEGLSNREIGQRLYLSHRTVGSHLYRVFPKLGVTSRGQLRDALAEG